MLNKIQHFRPDFLPWNISDTYWIAIESEDLSNNNLAEELNLIHVEDNLFALKCESEWVEKWTKLEQQIKSLSSHTLTALISQEKLPSSMDLRHELRPTHYLSTIAKNAWLGEALLDNRIVTFLQPVIDSHGKTFGYEAFARGINKDGSIVSGGDIIKASREMRIEYRLDRFLHSKAIESLVKGNYQGILFVNFLPGFIQKPDIYLEGLTREVSQNNLTPQRIALDLTKSEIPQNHKQLMAIRDYCRTRGHHISLENILAPDMAKRILGDLQPSFLKLDRKLTEKVETAEGKLAIKQIVRLAHANGVTVIASGIETEEAFETLKQINIDLFQGYYIGRPEQALLK